MANYMCTSEARLGHCQTSDNSVLSKSLFLLDFNFTDLPFLNFHIEFTQGWLQLLISLVVIKYNKGNHDMAMDRTIVTKKVT